MTRFCEIFFGDNHKIGLNSGVISIHFRVSSKVQGTEWGIIFRVAKISNIFLQCLKFLICLGCMVDAGPEPMYGKMRVPPPPPGGPFSL